MKYLSPHRKIFKTFKNLLKRVFTTFTPPSNVQLIYTVVRTLVNFIHHPYLIKPSFSLGSCCQNYYTTNDNYTAQETFNVLACLKISLKNSLPNRHRRQKLLTDIIHPGTQPRAFISNILSPVVPK